MAGGVVVVLGGGALMAHQGLLGGGPSGEPFDFPPPAVRPPFVEDGADDASTAAAVAKGGKILLLAMGASPLAPLLPFAGPVVAVLTNWASEAERSKVAQPRLQEMFAAACQAAEYEEYMQHYRAARVEWELFDFGAARTALEDAVVAGRAARLKTAKAMDELCVGAYREWMANAKRAFLDDDFQHLRRGWQLGDGGFTGTPLLYDVTTKPDGSWSYTSLADGKTRRYNWRPGHPDYDGTPYPPLTPEEYAARVEQLDRLAYAENIGAVPSPDNTYVPSPLPHPPSPAEDMKHGDGRRGEQVWDEDLGDWVEWDPRTKKPKAPPAPPVEPPPPPKEIPYPPVSEKPPSVPKIPNPPTQVWDAPPPAPSPPPPAPPAPPVPPPPIYADQVGLELDDLGNPVGGGKGPKGKK